MLGTVRAELAFPLENAGLGAAAVARGVEEAALALGIAGLLDRSTHELSGGELQRVALGAALATRPRARPARRADRPARPRRRRRAARRPAPPQRGVGHGRRARRAPPGALPVGRRPGRRPARRRDRLRRHPAGVPRLGRRPSRSRPRAPASSPSPASRRSPSRSRTPAPPSASEGSGPDGQSLVPSGDQTPRRRVKSLSRCKKVWLEPKGAAPRLRGRVAGGRGRARSSR